MQKKCNFKYAVTYLIAGAYKNIAGSLADFKLISDVLPGSLAGNAQLRPGDLIKKINHRPVEGLKEFNEIVKRVSKTDDAMLVIKRKQIAFFVILPGEK